MGHDPIQFPGAKPGRYRLLDAIRGFAVLLMIIFHLFYDLRLFGYNKISFSQDLFWWSFPRVIVFLFLVSVGLALPIVHTPHIKWKRFWLRTGKIALFALIISITTYVLFPSRWIYFGTLHTIAVCSLLALPFLKRPWISFSGFLGLSVPAVLGFDFPWIKLPHRSMDYIPALPWVGIVLLGIFLYHRGVHKWSLPDHFLTRFLRLLGRHSLVIYLVHQPILYGSIWLIHRLWG